MSDPEFGGGEAAGRAAAGGADGPDEELPDRARDVHTDPGSD